MSDFSDESDEAGEPQSAPQGDATEAAPRSTEAARDLPPPPQNTTSISWTGLSAPEPTETASEPSASTTTPDESQQPVTAEPPSASNAPSAVDAPSVAAETAATGEKKVVWSSSPPDRYSSFGGGTRRDDY